MNQGTLQAREKIHQGLEFLQDYERTKNDRISYENLIAERDMLVGLHSQTMSDVAPYVNKSKEDKDGEKNDKDEVLERLAKSYKSDYDKMVSGVEGKIFCKELDATLCTIDEKKHLKTPLREDYLAKELRQASDNVHKSYILFMRDLGKITDDQLREVRNEAPDSMEKINEWNDEYKQKTGKDSPYFSKIGDYITILKKKVDEILGDEE
jgi:hypothetical protein